ncbi:copper resistance CopC family protein [Sphaerisporangium aureirubrum]|uniref:Copper resistance protein CopC n=1 Tax=Sphaerisporangium aureirubrum TaxID=1544736 RepID=A0ABW1NE76_9ACTN
MRRVVPRLLAVVALSLAALSLGGAVPASAHGRLVVSTPLDGSVLAEPVESLSLAFTEKPASFAYFTVTTPSGLRVDGRWWHAEPFRLDEPVREYQLVDGVWEPQLYHTGFPVKVPVTHWPEKGAYVARYQTVASDGEVVKGEVRLTYTGPVMPAPAGWLAPTDGPAQELLDAARQSPPAAGPPGPTPTSAGGSATPADGGSAAPADGGGMPVWLLPALLAAGAVVLIAWPARRRKRP